MGQHLADGLIPHGNDAVPLKGCALSLTTLYPPRSFHRSQTWA